MIYIISIDGATGKTEKLGELEDFKDVETEIHFDTFINIICHFLTIKKDILLSKRKNEPYVFIRHIIWYIMKVQYRISNPSLIGKKFNKCRGNVYAYIEETDERLGIYEDKRYIFYYELIKIALIETKAWYKTLILD